MLGSLKSRQKPHVRLSRALPRLPATVSAPSAAPHSRPGNRLAPAGAEPNGAAGAKLWPAKPVTRRSGLSSSPLST